MVAAFVDHIENSRGISVHSRNVRLAAIHSLFRFAVLRHPEHAEDIQRVLAIPTKRGDHTIVTYLTDDGVEAMLAAPDPNTRTGRLLVARRGRKRTDSTTLPGLGRSVRGALAGAASKLVLGLLEAADVVLGFRAVVLPAGATVLAVDARFVER